MVTYPFRYLWWLLGRLRRAFARPPDYVVFLLEGELPPLPDPPRPLWQRFTGRPRLSLKELGERFDRVAKDGRITGVVLNLRPLAMSMAGVEDLRDHVARLRAAGKRVVAWSTFYNTATYYAALACDEITIMPTGSIMPLGFASTGMFLADGLARLGLVADFVQVSPFKTAADPFTRSRMSDAYREQMTWLLKARHDELVSAIVSGRRLTPEVATQLVDGSPYGDQPALEARAIDAIVPEEGLAEHLGSPAKPGMTLGTWERARRALGVSAPTTGAGQYVALLRIEGTIIDGRSGRLPVTPPVEIPLLGDDRAGDLSVVQVARQVAADKRAAAAVLYVNSRGGSATASEAMRQALAAVSTRKPLVVVMGPMAGSGGYLVSAPAAWIVARPSTLTGSIGVLSGKIVTGQLWPKLLLNRETIQFGRHATLEGDERGYTDEERAIVEREVNRTYTSFLGAVARSRTMDMEALRSIAGGRVWSGRQALERNLVDEMGGLDEGARKARSLADLPTDSPLREVRAPRRGTLPPTAAAAASGWLEFIVESLTLLTRAPALAVMDYLD